MYLILFLLSGLSIVNNKIAPLTFIVAIVCFIFIFKKYNNKFNSKAHIYLLLMIYALPFSWINFLGTGYSALPISWFNIFGVMYIFSIFFTREKKIPKNQLLLFIVSVLITLLSILPITYSTNVFSSDALSQLIVLTFHNILIVFTIFIYGSVSQEKSRYFYFAYIQGVYYTSLMLILQFISINYVPFEFGIVKYYLNRESLMFIFGDASHGSLYLATGAFLLFAKIFNKEDNTKNIFVQLIIIFSGVSLTSARTGLFVLIGFVGIFVIFKLKTFSQKFLGTIGSIGLIVIANKSMNAVRNLENQNFLDSSGRIQGYIDSLKLLKEHPFIGYGYGQSNLVEILNFPIPHLSILQYAMHFGIILTSGLFLIQFLILIDSYNKRSILLWLIGITLVGTCLIPDLFATRFITILCVFSLAQENYTAQKTVNLQG